jgi:hypothetical protein
MPSKTTGSYSQRQFDNNPGTMQPLQSFGGGFTPNPPNFNMSTPMGVTGGTMGPGINNMGGGGMNPAMCGVMPGQTSQPQVSPSLGGGACPMCGK